jgi:hypothetical protein
VTEQFDLPAVLTELLYGNEAVNNFVIDLRDLGRSKEEITNELDRLLSTDDD